MENAKKVNKDNVDVQSFKLYTASDSDDTVIEDDELKIQSFRLYKEEDHE